MLVDSVLILSADSVPGAASAGARPSVTSTSPWFVADESNVLVRQLSRDASSLLQCSPLVLYGPSGSGKSSLARIVAGWHAAPPAPNERPGYAGSVSIAEFDRRVRHAALVGHLDDLLGEVERLPVWIVDDFHLFSGSGITDQALVRLLDQRHADGRLTIFVGQQSPGSVVALSDRLRSRLYAGLMLPVRFPRADGMRRFAILAAAAAGLEWEPTALEAVIQAQTTCRAVGNLLQRIRQRGEADRLIRMADVRPLEQSQEIVPVSSGLILRAVLRHFKLSRAQLVGPSRRKTLVRARGLTICLLRDLGRLHWKPIATLTGRVDHSTALHAYHKTKQLLNQDPSLAQVYRSLSSQLSQPTED